MKKTIFILVIFYSLSFFAQQDLLEQKIDSIAKIQKGLNDKIKIDVSDLRLKELIKLLAEEHHLNISVDDDLTQKISSNFYDISIKDILLFLVHKYHLDIELINEIIYLKKATNETRENKRIHVNYRKENDFVSLNIKSESLIDVAEAITSVTEKNIVLSPDVKNKKVSIFIKNRPFEQALQMFAKSNQLKINLDNNGFYYIEKLPQQNTKTNNKTHKYKTNRNNSSHGKKINITLNENGLLDIKANEADILSIIKKAASLTHENYFIISKPESINKTIHINQISFEDLLENLFANENYTYKKKNNYYIIGKNDDNGIRITELITLENRTIESVLASIPKKIVTGLEIKEFVELNALIVTGTESKVKELKNFIFKIDKVVPLVQIEVLIVQYKKSHDVQTGIVAGLNNNNETAPTSGVIFPNTNINMNASSINNLLASFEGFGIINIGRVAKNFYLNLKTLENNSIIDMKSTPKIATLSGHQASVSIGETSYYFEQTNKLINSGINQNILQTGQWKSTNASLTVTIKPFVSSDEYITLEIKVEKSSFLGRAGENAPPGKVSQKFDALIRVKNNEMVLLGGLDEIEHENAGSGTPFLSRIPIIKWFFSSRKKKRAKSKLHVFIRPKVIY